MPPAHETSDASETRPRRWDEFEMGEFQRMPAHVMRGVFSSDVEALHALAQEAEAELDLKHHGCNGDRHTKTYLHTQRFLQQRAPALCAKFVDTMRRADAAEWHFLDNLDDDEEEPTLRVIEYHTYVRGAALSRKDHFDGGSIMTMVIMLSRPGEDFQGGKLQTWEGGDHFTTYDLKLGDCVVFPSHKFHNVTEVVDGLRHIAAIEMWLGDEGETDERPGSMAHLL